MNDLTSIKQKVMELRGKQIAMRVNRGRNKIVHFSGVIDKVYPSMFVIKPMEQIDLERKSFSYNDVLCGDIQLK